MEAPLATHHRSPGDLLATSGAYWQSCALHAAVKLDVFSKLGDERLTAAEMAGRLDGAPRGVAPLLNALAAMRLLTKQEGRYANSESSRRLLCKDAPAYLGHMIMHHQHLVESWAHLDQAVVTGRPVRERASVSGEQWRESFLMGMFNMAMAVAPAVVGAVDLSGRSRLLDLGGGPGTYAIQFCLNNHGLRAGVFDLPTTRPFAERTISRFGMGDRVEFIAGDYHVDEIPGRFDVVLLSHILHAEGPDQCATILRKAIAVLEPGGMVIIHEFILGDSEDGPLFPALFSLNMLLGTPAGRAYSGGDLAAMLLAAGAREIRRIPVHTPNDSGLITGLV